MFGFGARGAGNRRFGAALTATAAVLALASPVGRAAGEGANDNTDQASLTRTFITSADGTRLETNVYHPVGVPEGRRVPVIVYVSPYLNTGASGLVPQPQGPPVSWNFPYDLEEAGLFEKGYAFVQVALRGTAGSEGCNDLGGKGEQADAVAAVEWAASQPWSNGRVGIWGHSYDGWTGLMALANKPDGLKAVVADSPIINPYDAIHMNGVTYLTAGYIADVAFQYYDLMPPSLASGQEAVINALTGSATSGACYAEKTAAFRNPDPSAPVWKARNLRPALRGASTPVLLSFGFGDELARPRQFPLFWRFLSGSKHAWFGQWGHNAASAPDPGSWWPDELVGRRGFSAATLRFFDRHLARRHVRALPGAVVERSDGSWRKAESWPPEGRHIGRLDLLAGSFRDAPGSSADGRGIEVPQVGRLPVTGTGAGDWSVSDPLARSIHIAGVPRIRATLEEPVPGSNLVAVLYDIDPKGVASVISRGARRLGGTDEPRVNLYPQDWLVERGHRVAVLLSGSDDSTFTPGLTLRAVGVTSGYAEIPMLCRPARSDLRGSQSAAAAIRPQIEVAGDVIDQRISGPLHHGLSSGPACGPAWWD